MNLNDIKNLTNKPRQDAVQLERETFKPKSRNKALYGEVFFAVILAIITLMLIGLVNLIVGSFDWEMYQTPEFWKVYITTQIGAWFTRIWVFMIRKRYHKRTHKDFVNANDRIEKYVKVDYDTPYIDKNVLLDDFNRKKHAWKNKQKRKLIKLISKYQLTNVLDNLKMYENNDFKGLEKFLAQSNIKYRTTPLNVFKSKIKRIKSFEKKLEKVSYKVQSIFYQMSDEYVIQNIDILKVKYNQVSRSILTSGIDVGDSGMIGYNYDKNTATTFVKEFIPMFLMFSAISFLIIPFLKGSEFVKDWEVWGRFIISLFTVVSAGVMMIFSSEELFETTELRSIRAREETLKTYYEKEKEN